MDSTSSLEFALLGLLRAEPQTGYDLRKRFVTTPLRHFSDSPGSVYPALSRLARRGWIVALKEAGGPRNRQRFEVTPDGAAAFHAWLEQPATREDVVSGLGSLLLRFAFMGGVVAPERIGEFLRGLERELEAYVAELRSYLATHRPEISASTTGLLAFEHGIESYEVELAWTRRAIAEVSHEVVGHLEGGSVRDGVRGDDASERNAGSGRGAYRAEARERD